MTKMKNTWIILLTGVSLFFAACSGNTGKTDAVDTDKAGEEAQATETSATYALDTEASTLNWKGSKSFTDDFHQGTIKITEGSLSTENGNVIAGNFTVDMASIEENTDNQEMAAKLIGHLKSPDFFLVDSFPTASFSIVKVEGNNITGNLEIKGVAKEITFPAEIEVGEEGVNASASFVINRMDWGVEYGNGSIVDLAKDKIISNDIEFVVNLKATKEG
jgi:polyisoprenoid-binding protein YceI